MINNLFYTLWLSPHPPSPVIFCCLRYCFQILLEIFIPPRNIWKQWLMQNMGGIWVLGNREWRKFSLLTIEIHAPFLVEFFKFFFFFLYFIYLFCFYRYSTNNIQIETYKHYKIYNNYLNYKKKKTKEEKRRNK